MKLKIPESLTRQAYRRIRNVILSTELSDGYRLTEEYLARELGISKSPVRDALNQLESDGLIHILPRRGASIRAFSARDVEEIYDLREALECHLMRSVRLSPETTARLHRLLDAANVHLQSGDRLRYIHTDMEFHSLLARCGSNGRIRQVLDKMYSQLLLLRLRTYELSGQRSTQQHRQILLALEKGDNRRAEQLMARHISTVRARLLTSMQGDDRRTAPA